MSLNVTIRNKKTLLLVLLPLELSFSVLRIRSSQPNDQRLPGTNAPEFEAEEDAIVDAGSTSVQCFVQFKASKLQVVSADVAEFR